jgi:hypothetical protein
LQLWRLKKTPRKLNPRPARPVKARLEMCNSDKVKLFVMTNGAESMHVEAITDQDRQARRILEGVAKGERAVRDGRIVSHEDARKKLLKWLSE